MSNHREHLVDLSQLFSGFEFNNELVNEGSEMFENGGYL